MKKENEMKAKMVIGQVCPNCGRNVDHMIHTLWEGNKLRSQVQEDIKNGRRLFAPFGQFNCECRKIVFIQLYGDAKGFVSFLFENDDDRKFVSETAIKGCIEKGISPGALDLAVKEMFGMTDDQGVCLFSSTK